MTFLWFKMAGSAVVLQLISLFFCCVSGALLQYGSTRLFGSPSNVTLTVGATNQRVYCLQATGPVPTSIEWYNPQGQLVSRDVGDEVNQRVAGGGRIVHLNFHSYHQSQGGKYECRVNVSGNNTESLPVCIGPTSKRCAVPPSKVVGVRVSPGVQNTSLTLTVMWQLFASEAVNYTVKYSTRPGEVNTPPEGAMEVMGISGTSTNLTALERGTTYYIWVVGVSEGGEGPHSDRMSGVTYDNVTRPTGARVSVVALNEAGKVRVTWSRPTLGPGQVITGYSVQYRRRGTTSYTTRSVSGSSTTSYTVTNLNLGTVYEVRVASVGPLGLSGYCCGSGKQVTTYSSPGPVLDLSYEEDTDTSVNITWKPPKEPNGVIVAYFVEHGVYNKKSAKDVRIHASRPRYTIIQALEPGVPYNITVRASTAVGKGEPVSIVVFAVQQAPTTQVSNVKFEKLSNNRAAFVSWTPLPLHQARGFPVYFVAYHPSGQAAGAESTVINTTDSEVVIGSLDPTTDYTFTVDVGTAGGKSSLDAVEAESISFKPVCSDSSSATGVGLFLGGLVAGALGVVLIGGIVGGACLLRRSKHKSSPSGKAAGEDVPMEDNPAYGDVNVYDTVKKPKEN